MSNNNLFNSNNENGPRRKGKKTFKRKPNFLRESENRNSPEVYRLPATSLPATRDEDPFIPDLPAHEPGPVPAPSFNVAAGQGFRMGPSAQAPVFTGFTGVNQPLAAAPVFNEPVAMPMFVDPANFRGFGDVPAPPAPDSLSGFAAAAQGIGPSSFIGFGTAPTAPAPASLSGFGAVPVPTAPAPVPASLSGFGSAPTAPAPSSLSGFGAAAQGFGPPSFIGFGAEPASLSGAASSSLSGPFLGLGPPPARPPSSLSSLGASNDENGIPLQRRHSIMGFNLSINTKKEKHDAIIVEVDKLLDTLIGFGTTTAARKGVHQFVLHFCGNDEPDQVVDFLTAVLLPLQFDLDMSKDMVSKIGDGYSLVTGRLSFAYLREFSLSPSDQLPLALREINQKNLEQGYLQEGTLNQFTDQELLKHTNDFFLSDIDQRKEQFSIKQLKILLSNPSYKEGDELEIFGVESIGETLVFGPQYSIAGHVTNVKNLTLALVALADTNKELAKHQETKHPEQISNLHLELTMVIKLGPSYNRQHKSMTRELEDENMYLVAASYLSRLYVCADNFRDMVKKDYLVKERDAKGITRYRDVSKGKSFQKIFLWNLARLLALIACTVPEMEDAILLAKKLGPDPALLRKYFQDFAKATTERTDAFLRICQTKFRQDMFGDFPPLKRITIKTLPDVFKKYFLHFFKSDQRVIGVYPEIIHFKQAATFPKISLSSFKPGRRITAKHARIAAIAGDPDPYKRAAFTYEYVEAIEQGSRPTQRYKDGYIDGFRLDSIKNEFSNLPEYVSGYMAGQRAISGISGMIRQIGTQADEMNKPISPTVGKVKVIEIAETRAKMAYSGAISIKSLTLEGMEKSRFVVLNGLQDDVLDKCLQRFTTDAEQAATEAETAYTELVKELGALDSPSKRKMNREAKMASVNARKMATDIKAITIRPMSPSNKSGP